MRPSDNWLRPPALAKVGSQFAVIIIIIIIIIIIVLRISK